MLVRPALFLLNCHDPFHLLIIKLISGRFPVQGQIRHQALSTWDPGLVGSPAGLPFPQVLTKFRKLMSGIFTRRFMEQNKPPLNTHYQIDLSIQPSPAAVFSLKLPETVVGEHFREDHWSFLSMASPLAFLIDRHTGGFLHLPNQPLLLNIICFLFSLSFCMRNSDCS